MNDLAQTIGVLPIDLTVTTDQKTLLTNQFLGDPTRTQFPRIGLGEYGSVDFIGFQKLDKAGPVSRANQMDIRVSPMNSFRERTEQKRCNRGRRANPHRTAEISLMSGEHKRYVVDTLEDRLAFGQ